MMATSHILTTAVALLFVIPRNLGRINSWSCDQRSLTNPRRVAMKSFSAEKYLRVEGDIGSRDFKLSFTGNFNICDTRILFDQQWIVCTQRPRFSIYSSVAFPSHYLAVDNGKLVLAKQSQISIENKCYFQLHRVKVSYNLDNFTLRRHHALYSYSADSFIRSTDSGMISLGKEWKFDCGTWFHFNDTIPSCSS